MGFFNIKKVGPFVKNLLKSQLAVGTQKLFLKNLFR